MDFICFVNFYVYNTHASTILKISRTNTKQLIPSLLMGPRPGFYVIIRQNIYALQGMALQLHPKAFAQLQRCRGFFALLLQKT